MTTALGPRLPFDRYVAIVRDQAARLGAVLEDADLDLGVPTCPAWNLAQLAQHVGEELRWLERLVRTRATSMPDDTTMRVLDPVPARHGAALATWIVDGADGLAQALVEAGPDTGVWTPFPGGRVGLFARRFAHELLIHRLDAVLALGLEPDVHPGAPDAALDVLAEWMELAALPMMLEVHPERRALLGPGRTLRWVVTDADGPDATWLVDLREEPMRHLPGVGGAAAVEVRGELAAIVLALYRRRGLDTLTVDGDRDLLARWSELSAFA